MAIHLRFVVVTFLFLLILKKEAKPVLAIIGNRLRGKILEDLHEEARGISLGLEKVIYHQTMTPSWLEKHASYKDYNRVYTDQELKFTPGSVDHVALLEVPLIPADVLPDSAPLTVKIVVSNDVSFGAGDSNTRYGVSDGISFVGFETVDIKNYRKYYAGPCFGIEGNHGANQLTGMRSFLVKSGPNDSFYPGQFVITLKLDAGEHWGSCYTIHDGGLVKTAIYSKQLLFSKGLALLVYKDSKKETVGIKFIEVTVVQGAS